jgi:uncharacterized tellurite resistance protein B-like protein
MRLVARPGSSWQDPDSMISRAQEFFRRHFGGPGDVQVTGEQQQRVAVAALLLEVLRADYDVSAAESRQVLASVGGMLKLSDAEAGEVMALAEAEMDKAHDLFQFTSQVNAAFDHEQKIRLVEELWRVARSDQLVHKYEEHIIRRVAGLLHLRHSEFITAKLRAGA